MSEGKKLRAGDKVMLDREGCMSYPREISRVAKDGRLQIGQHWYRMGENEDGLTVRMPNAEEAKRIWKDNLAKRLGRYIAEEGMLMDAADLDEIRRIVEKYEKKAE